jgi:hypothetical protein
MKGLNSSAEFNTRVWRFQLGDHVTVWSQYHPRERVDQTLDLRVECLTHPLTGVVLTSSRRRGHIQKA